MDKGISGRLAILVAVFLSACSSTPKPKSATETKTITIAPKDFAIQKLQANGFSGDFIHFLLKRYQEDDRDEIVAANILGFLEKADYSAHYSKRAVRKCLKFIRQHKSTLQKAEESYGVSQEVVAALLWVETKFGRHLGTIPVPNVYFSLLQSDHPKVLNSTLATLKEKYPHPDEATVNQVIARSKTKADWALGELKSLEEMYNKNGKKIAKLRGSYAGAFGMSQFIPSTYLLWEKSQENASNLYRPRDAILSVAFYLKENGWKEDEPSAQKDSLFHYNHAQGYGEVILKIAQSVREKSLKNKRVTTSISEPKSDSRSL